MIGDHLGYEDRYCCGSQVLASAALLSGPRANSRQAENVASPSRSQGDGALTVIPAQNGAAMIRAWIAALLRI